MCLPTNNSMLFGLILSLLLKICFCHSNLCISKTTIRTQYQSCCLLTTKKLFGFKVKSHFCCKTELLNATLNPCFIFGNPGYVFTAYKPLSVLLQQEECLLLVCFSTKICVCVKRRFSSDNSLPRLEVDQTKDYPLTFPSGCDTGLVCKANTCKGSNVF